jgi:hypothetical protein
MFFVKWISARPTLKMVGVRHFFYQEGIKVSVFIPKKNKKNYLRPFIYLTVFFCYVSAYIYNIKGGGVVALSLWE